MSRSKKKIIFIGEVTAEILKASPEDAAGALMVAIINWAQSGSEPEVPEQYRAEWAAIRYESIKICEARKVDVANGKKAIGTPKATQRTPKATQSNPIATPWAPNGHQDIDEDEDIDEINPDVPDVARARATQAIGSSIHRSSVEFSSLVSSFSSDPVDDAMIVCKTAKKDDRRCFGKFLKDLGQKEFTDVVRMLQSEINAGEIPDNRAACLVAKLKDRATVLRAMA